MRSDFCLPLKILLSLAAAGAVFETGFHPLLAAVRSARAAPRRPRAAGLPEDERRELDRARRSGRR